MFEYFELATPIILSFGILLQKLELLSLLFRKYLSLYISLLSLMACIFLFCTTASLWYQYLIPEEASINDSWYVYMNHSLFLYPAFAIMNFVVAILFYSESTKPSEKNKVLLFQLYKILLVYIFIYFW
jgi:hypothetical protein